MKRPQVEIRWGIYNKSTGTLFWLCKTRKEARISVPDGTLLRIHRVKIVPQIGKDR